ncbi:ABC transporter substrate-binding protein [Mesorhizobium sp.]|uniref:ABC transporter substrate-binding protein n=1 Tax=Mesorhizobium sp. TaxID=1871066 RepID=UPI0025C6ADA4|nr:ABC transporter substrate-binding protein [Mesorhizobium sp.]
MSYDQSNYLQQQFVDRKISRREFVGRVGALGLAAATATSLISLGTQARAQTPRSGGRLKLGWYTSSASDTLRPGRMSSTTDFLRAWQVGSNLIRYSRKMTAEPDLATEWEPNKDLTQWRFKIRKGVEFHNGKKLTLDDIIYSLNLHRGEKSDSAVRTFFNDFKDIRKDGDDVLVIELQSPNADLPMTVGDVHTIIAPQGFEDWNNFVGTGPFKLKHFQPGIEMLVERNPNYFGKAPHVDEVSSIGIQDNAARMNALVAGDVHYIVRVDPKLVDAIGQAPGVAMAASASGRRITFPMQVDAAPFDNPDLRMAILYSAKRQSMVKDVLKGMGMVGNDTPIAPTDVYHDPNLPQRDFDLDKAKFHLKKAGMDGKSVTLHMSDAAGGPVAPDLAQHLKESSAEVGLNIELQREPSDGYYTNVWLKRPFCMGHLIPRPTADLTISLIYHSKAAWNETHFKDPELDALIERARSVLDGPERREIYNKAQRIIYDRSGCLIPVHPHWLDARSDKLMGWEGDPSGEGCGYRISELVWLDE